MAPSIIHLFSDIITSQSHTTSLLSARSSTSPTTQNDTGLSNAEKVTLYVIAALVAILIMAGMAFAIFRTRRCHAGNLQPSSLSRAFLKSIPLIQYEGSRDEKSQTLTEAPYLVNSVRSECQGPVPPSSLAERIMSILKTADSVCAICTDEFVKGQLLRVLPCAHVFHQTCVDEWLVQQSRTCPSCRYELRSPSQEQEAMTEKTKGSHDLERGPPRVADGSDPQPRWAQRLWSFLRRQGVRSSLSQ